jgi:hypothetical protein
MIDDGEEACQPYAKLLNASGLADSPGHTNSKIPTISRPTTIPRLTHRYHANTANMRTYDDSFSGQKIYPGKVRSAVTPMPRPRQLSNCRYHDATKRTPGGGYGTHDWRGNG